MYVRMYVAYSGIRLYNLLVYVLVYTSLVFSYAMTCRYSVQPPVCVYV